MSEILTARVVPYNRPSAIYREGRAQLIEFSREAFAAQARGFDDEAPDIPVTWGHDREAVIGYVVDFVPKHRSNDWVEVLFTIAEDLPAEMSEYIVPGVGVSAGFGQLARTSVDPSLGYRLHEDVYMDHLAVIRPDQVPAIPGAEILAREPWHEVPVDITRAERNTLSAFLADGFHRHVAAREIIRARIAAGGVRVHKDVCTLPTCTDTTPCTWCVEQTYGYSG